MAGRDYDSFLDALRLHREQIGQAISAIEHLVKTERSSTKPPSWAKALTGHDEDDDHHITYKQILRTLEQNREHADEAILAIEKLARPRKTPEGNAANTPKPGKSKSKKHPEDDKAAKRK